MNLLLSIPIALAVAVSGLLGPDRVESGASEAAASLPDLGRVGNWLGLCTGPLSLLATSELCTHGPDPAPPGFDIDEQVQPLVDQVARQQMAGITCDGDGQSGSRVQVLYVHGSDVASRYDRFRLSIQGWAGAMDQIFQDSAAETGGVRGVRFMHDASCQPIVDAVEVSPAGVGSFDATIAELRNRGYNRTDRIYLAFVDTTSAGICGIGTIWNDDRASSANWNNSGPSYSRVDAGCWGGHVAAHEVMHNLGGVQLSAPNSSGAFHCIDEFDVMCYRDGPQTTTREDCPSEARDTTRFDCNHNDYYHTNPASGSYLATFWNPASNQFLIGSTAPVATDGTVQDQKQKKAKKEKKSKKGKKGKKSNKGNKGKHDKRR